MERLFEQWAGEPCLKKSPILANGSNRHYFRLIGETHQCIGAVNSDIRENEAFFYFSELMRSKGINAPEVYAITIDRTTYLQQDLGDNTVYTYLTSKKSSGIDVTEEQRSLYRRVIDDLVKIQFLCKDANFNYSYPRSDFDRQSLQWDMNYFKYYFLKLLYIPFDEQLLENDYSAFIDYLLEADCSFFLYRDFQARNIMLTKDEELYYIDFQGARRGAAQYDLAALLYSAKSEIPQELREELLEYYVEKYREQLSESERLSFDEADFKLRFYGYVLARMMQAMGAYGYRGLYEKKDYFVKSIPLAVDNMRKVVKNHELPIDIPHLKQVWKSIVEHEDFQPKDTKLSVKVFSFSYKKGIPVDKSGNGGGFVFDCRGLPNPGRYEEYKRLTGRDEPVIAYLKEKEEVINFVEHAKALVAPSVEKYIERGFSSLMVCFGCTGGQHRSVFCAERMAEFLRQNYDCRVVIRHREQER